LNAKRRSPALCELGQGLGLVAGSTHDAHWHWQLRRQPLLLAHDPLCIAFTTVRMQTGRAAQALIESRGGQLLLTMQALLGLRHVRRGPRRQAPGFFIGTAGLHCLLRPERLSLFTEKCDAASSSRQVRHTCGSCVGGCCPRGLASGLVRLRPAASGIRPQSASAETHTWCNW